MPIWWYFHVTSGFKKLTEETTTGNSRSRAGNKRIPSHPIMFCFAGGCEQPRREENPFSFKHFLNRDATSGGARPKVYPSKSPSTPRLIANPELTSGLPDFVQDHLVIEQCYLNQQPSQPLSVDIHNLADFGLGLVSLPLRQTLLVALCTIISRATMQQG